MLPPIAAFRRSQPALSRTSCDSGQSLIETALAVPFLLLIALNAINFAYYFFVAINLAAAPRNAVEYSVQGLSTPPGIEIPKPDIKGKACTSSVRGNPDLSVSSLAYYDVIAVLPNTGTGNPCPNIAAVQVCNSQNGFVSGTASTASQAVVCTQYGPAASPAFASAAPDPEAPGFVLDRVDIQYTVKPLIGGTLPLFGGIKLNILPSLNFHRQVSMREMN